MSSSIKSAAIFLGEFLRNPRQLGSIIPSSRFLKRRIIAAADLAGVSVVVELGPGNGGTTRSILNALPANARLISIELNEGLHALNSEIKDPRYIAHHGNAADLSDILQQHQTGRPDVVISGIPFSTMQPEAGKAILECVHKELVDGGRFIVYQVSARADELNSYYANGSRSVAWEWFNLPPLRVWRWHKAESQESAR